MPRRRLKADARPTVETLLALGEDEAAARVVGALLGNGQLMLGEIARRAAYHPLYVRRTLDELDRRGWVDSEELSTGKRGGKPLAYWLSVTRSGMLDHYHQQALKRVTATFKSAKPW